MKQFVILAAMLLLPSCGGLLQPAADCAPSPGVPDSASATCDPNAGLPTPDAGGAGRR